MVHLGVLCAAIPRHRRYKGYIIELAVGRAIMAKDKERRLKHYFYLICHPTIFIPLCRIINSTEDIVTPMLCVQMSSVFNAKFWG